MDATPSWSQAKGNIQTKMPPLSWVNTHTATPSKLSCKVSDAFISAFFIFSQLKCINFKILGQTAAHNLVVWHKSSFILKVLQHQWEHNDPHRICDIFLVWLNSRGTSRVEGGQHLKSFIPVLLLSNPPFWLLLVHPQVNAQHPCKTSTD